MKKFIEMIRKFIGKIIKFIDNIINMLFLFGFIGTIIFILLLMNGISPYITISGSMEPKIQTGSLCFVDTNVCYEEIKEGDIVAFQTFTGSMVTHRVVSVTENGLETKGDANKVSDGVSVTQDNFHGKTIFSIPYIGYILSSMKQIYKKIIVWF